MTISRSTRNPQQTDVDERRGTVADLVDKGSYREVVGRQLLPILAEAAEQLPEQGLREEIGALRLVLARLLNEEADLDRLAINVARIVDATVRAARVQFDVTSQATTDLLADVQRLLAEIDPAAGPEEK